MGFSFLSLCIALSSLTVYYQCNVGAIAAVHDEWAVVIHGGIDTANEIAKNHGVTCVGQIGNLVNHYRFIGNKKAIGSNYRQFESKLKRNDKVIKVIPQARVKRVQKRYTVPQDPKFPNQWSLNNTGQTNGAAGLDLNVERAWLQNLTGNGILVAVVDSGVKRDVDDIRENYDSKASYNFVDFGTNPFPNPLKDGTSATHGTYCAGVIAMIKNDKCGVGVAYKSKIAGLRIDLSILKDTTDAEEASALGHMPHDIMVSSNSWGPPDDGYSFIGPGNLVKATFTIASTQGRNGKGSVYVFSSGNGGESYDSCAADGYVNSIYTIAVGSADQNGNQASYDEDCTAKMAVTYSRNTPHYTATDEDKLPQLVTVDLSNQCIDNFTGTSASAPLVSATIALVLERNPNLSWRDIQYLIAYTSDTTKLQGDPFTTNGAGLKVNSQFGFGAIDAEAMVTRATHWTNVSKQIHSRISDVVNKLPYTLHQTPNGVYYKVYRLSVEVTKTVTSITFLEHVAVTVSFTMGGLTQPTLKLPGRKCHVPYKIKNPCRHINQWTNRGGISISLVSPVGTKSLLLPNRPCDVCQDGLENWTFMSVHHWGENPVGTWTIVIKFISQSEYLDISGVQIFDIYGVTETPKSVQRIPSSCDPACVRGCAASGSQYCDSCKNYRDPVTLDCLDSCSKIPYNGYCLDYDPTSVSTKSSISATDKEVAGISTGGGIILIILMILVILTIAWGMKKYKKRRAEEVTDDVGAYTLVSET